ncbi:hypothetical protein BuS5_02489 [Desulfosarcina sp. BuS5]|uniref:hypothetical protein n=1 Tax=Desulfosarcina sp. BuS5 TaxID=933262 RepID=UPI00048202E8|nr:hypothetical protein [Desulfosarcina sp. BuS5]WDN89521.1 hypothetical protein BuS5_02489 [Desulfosarcina sp. BuS5]
MKGKIHRLRIGIIQKRLMALFMSIIFTSYTFCGCAGTTKQLIPTNTGKKDSFIHVIIDDKFIKSEKYGPKLVGKIEEVFRKSFENVSVRTGYDNCQIGDMLIQPTTLSVVPSKLETGEIQNTYLYANIRVITNNSSLEFTITETTEGETPGVVLIGEILLAYIFLFPIGGSYNASDLVDRAFTTNKALKIGAIDLHNKIISSSEFKAYANSSQMIQTSPATLTAQLHYSDKTSFLPNNTIDAAEKSTITAIITNSGKGTAFDVNLITESKYKNINFPETIPIGDIQPGESKDITIPINADLSLASGTASFLINAREKRGYDARPVELQISAAQLRSPELLFASCNINDSSGLADGDGDGVPENNEIIELNPYVSNKGIGDALKISVQLTNITDGIEIIKKKDDLTSIGSGAIGKSTLAFKIPRTFAQPEIKYTVAATDVRGMRTEKTYTIPFQSKAPELYCTYRIVDTGLREISTLKNGQSCRLKIIPKNTGKNIAEGVTLRVTSASGKANIGNYDNDIGVLSPDTTGSAVTVPVSLSRSFVGQSLTLNVSMEQDGFAGFSREITLPVMTTRPELECRVVLLNGISENAVSQNSRPKFRVSLSNNGSLDAKDVKIAFKANGANITYDKENFIGTIKAGESQYKDFTFFVRSR